MQPSETSRAPSTEQRSLLRGALWMLVLSLVLFWLPVLGPFIAGVVGGRVIGGRIAALLVALLPAIALAALIALILSLFELPVLGAVAGFGIFLVIAVQDLPLLVGAWVGASLEA